MCELQAKKTFSPGNIYFRVLYTIICSLPLVDMANGYIMRQTGGSYALFVKGLVLACMLTILIVYDHTSIKWLFLCTGLAIIVTLAHLSSVTDASQISSEVSWTFKFLYLYISYRFLRYYVRNYDNALNALFYFAFSCLIINSIISYLGYGYSQYEFHGDQVGSKGLFYAGNELSALLIIVATYVLFKSYQKKLITYLFCSALTMFCAAQIASKVALLGVLLMIVLVPLICLFGNARRFLVFRKSDFFRSFTILLFALISGSYLLYYVLIKLNLYSRLQYFYEKFDIITLLFSYRNVWAKDLMGAFLAKATGIDYLIGMSYDVYRLNGYKTVEIDFVDVFVVYGALGLLATYGFVILCSIRILNRLVLPKNMSNRSFFALLLLGIVLLLCVSLTAGHVFNSGIASSYFAGLLALGLYSEDNTNMRN